MEILALLFFILLAVIFGNNNSSAPSSGNPLIPHMHRKQIRRYAKRK